MINVCRHCGYVNKKCRACQVVCPNCGEELESVDYVTYILSEGKCGKDN